MPVTHVSQRGMSHTVQSATLADVLERILDKGLVIAGDIKIQIANVELLTIQIRLVIASVDKAKEIGIDWWNRHPGFSMLEPTRSVPTVPVLESAVAPAPAATASAIPAAMLEPETDTDQLREHISLLELRNQLSERERVLEVAALRERITQLESQMNAPRIPRGAGGFVGS